MAMAKMGQRPRSFKPKEPKKKTTNYAVNKDTGRASAVPDRQASSPSGFKFNPNTERVIKNKNDTYTIEMGGKRQTLTSSQWNALRESKKLGGRGTTPIADPAVEQAYQSEKAFNEQQRLASPEYRAAIEKQLAEEKARAAIMAELNPEPKFAGEPLSTGLPQLDPNIDIGEGVFKGAMSKGLESGLKAGSVAAVPAAVATLGSAGVGAPVAAGAVGVAAAGGFIKGAIQGGFSSSKSNKAKVLSESNSLRSDAEKGIKQTINLAHQGLPEGEVRERFQQDVEYLAQAQANLKELDKKDPSYFNLNGLDEQRDVDRAIANLEIYKAQLESALAAPDPSKVLYNLEEGQAQQPLEEEE